MLINIGWCIAFREERLIIVGLSYILSFSKLYKLQKAKFAKINWVNDHFIIHCPILISLAMRVNVGCSTKGGDANVKGLKMHILKTPCRTRGRWWCTNHWVELRGCTHPWVGLRGCMPSLWSADDNFGFNLQLNYTLQLMLLYIS